MSIEITNIYKDLANEIKEANSIMILTGAGISVASGIPDFRTSMGAFWLKNKDRVKLMSSHYRDSYPEKFWPAFKEIFDIKINNVFEPNYGHQFIKELEDMSKEVVVVTQNVDGLHQKAGSSTVLEMHGSMNFASCSKCGEKYDLQYIIENEVPRCNHTIEKHKVCNKYIQINNQNVENVKCNDCDTIHPVNGQKHIRCKGKKHISKQCDSYLKPDVVLFGDDIRHYYEAEKVARKCDLMLVLGSSLQVHPVAGLPLEANKLAIINLHKTDHDMAADYVIHKDINETLKEIKKYL